MARRPAARLQRAAVPIPKAAERRKLIAFEPEAWRALDQLARDRMMTLQELADEAFSDLLAKHHRPTDLKQALRASASKAGDKRGRGAQRRP